MGLVCSLCGAEMPDRAKFCTKCGNPFSPRDLKNAENNNEKFKSVETPLNPTMDELEVPVITDDMFAPKPKKEEPSEQSVQNNNPEPHPTKLIKKGNPNSYQRNLPPKQNNESNQDLFSQGVSTQPMGGFQQKSNQNTAPSQIPIPQNVNTQPMKGYQRNPQSQQNAYSRQTPPAMNMNAQQASGYQRNSQNMRYGANNFNQQNFNNFTPVKNSKDRVIQIILALLIVGVILFDVLYLFRDHFF